MKLSVKNLTKTSLAVMLLLAPAFAQVDKKISAPLVLQSFDVNQMWSEYNDLLMCYANATTMAQLQRCDNQANAFTQKYGGLSTLSVSLTPSEKRDISRAIDQIEREADDFKKQYYRSKPAIKREVGDIVQAAENNLNSLELQADQLREFFGIKAFLTQPLSL